MRLEPRFHESALDRVDEFAREFVALNCGVIFAGTPYAIRAAMKATSTIPIVGIDLESDPVASGLVKSVARPEGNLTGFFLDIPELGGKQIELLMEAVPNVSRLAVLWDATIGTVQFHATEMAPRPAGVTLQSLPIRRAEDINEAIEPGGARSSPWAGRTLVTFDLLRAFAHRQFRVERSAADDQSLYYVSKARRTNGLWPRFPVDFCASRES